MQRNKIQIFFRRFLVVLVLLCFVGMTGYSELLHDHDHDFSKSHNGCSPCNWTNHTKLTKMKKPILRTFFLSATSPFSDPF